MEKDLRLRLVVRRHGVPDVKLLWNATANEDLTISKLVAEVNEVIPLESGEWGLEDYAVELKDASGDGFECVHYHLVSKVLKEDDQVLIRPLLTDDLKRRKLSGRHQISSDGRHLVDGLAYGRSWLKAPRDRPNVALPPRKKARITYSSDDENDSPSETSNDTELPMIEYDSSTRAHQDPSSVKLRARFYDAESDGDEEGDDEFEPGADGDDDEDMGSEDDDIREELRLISEDNAAVREGDLLEELRSIRGKRASSGSRETLHSTPPRHAFPVASANNALVRSATRTSTGMDFLDKIIALRAAFPTAPFAIVEPTLLRCDSDPERAYRKLSKKFSAQLGIRQMLERQERSLSSSPIRHSDRNEGRELVLRETSSEEDSDSANELEEHLSNELNDDSDEASETLNHNTHPDSRGGKDELSSESSDSESSSESSAVASESDSDQEMDDLDKSSEDSSSDDSSESGDEAPVSDDNSEAADQDIPEESGSDSDSDGSRAVADRRSSEGAPADVDMDSSSGSSSDSSSDSPSDSSESDEESSSDDSSSDSDSDSDSGPEEIPATTLSKQYQTLQPVITPEPTKATPAVAPVVHAPTVPPGQGLTKTQKRNARRKLAKQSAAQGSSVSGPISREPSQMTAPETPDDIAALLARKKALLEAFVSDAPEESQSQEKSPEIPDSAPQDSSQVEHAEASQSPSTQEESAQRRMKPNVGAARRMLMGSLGLKNPKTKADEDKIRQELMKGVRPHTNARLTEASQSGESAQTQESVEEDPEAWREKIAYRAVECCHEGVELSEPPFPFVQRWDPQQQVEEWFGSKNKRGGKRKRVQRNQAQFYDDGDSQSSKKRRVEGDDSIMTFSEGVEEGDTTLNYDDPVEEPAAPKPRPEESQMTDVEDLPSLPDDLTTLPELRPGAAKAGMVITWKQWVLSTQTNWQPEVINVTGILVRVFDEDATDFEFLLARRDRDHDRKEKVYDESTGQRVYDRFEAPDDDEDDDESGFDDGYRRITFAELIEPKILQDPLDDKQMPVVNEESSGPTDSVVHETVYDTQSQPSQFPGKNASPPEADEDGSQSKIDAEDDQAKANTGDGQSQVVAEHDEMVVDTAEQDQSTSNPEPSVDDAQPADSIEDEADEDDVATPKASAQAKVKDVIIETEESQESGTSQAPTAFSISSDRRHEISLMIEEAGFRKDLSPSVLQRKTSSPTRQLMEMSEAANSRSSEAPVPEGSSVKDTTPVPPQSDSIPPPSSATSVRSGRQPDDDFSFHTGGDDVPMNDTGDGSPILGASTPKANVQTPPRQNKSPVEPGTTESFPSLEDIFLEATQPSTQNTESPSKSQVFSDIKSRKSIVKLDTDYEAAMRRIDEEGDEDGEEDGDDEEDEGDEEDEDDEADEDHEEEEDDESPQALRGTRKQLFPNSSQPAPSRSPELPDMRPMPKTAPSSFSESQDVKPKKPFIRFTKRKSQSSPFVIPDGSQVISLSSSPEPLVEEDYAEDEIDDDYQEKSSSLPHGSGWVKKNKPSRAKSMPPARTTANAAVGRRSIPPSSMPARTNTKSRGQRKSMTRF
ncbi:hypothetical protein CGCS363_v013736 [Colletotrichum siamense]|uniref:uncharacterized protein n=1 Tax=Colletotrichum siamense TaxID=690259 RepID=UPI00187302A9|nr:uncharacterized protein CGCS363_v013736 [Colletotrichum siamense]KAF5486887.1 hypothetical protein CGCS363_v013736 [Colletotrichum siamense]